MANITLEKQESLYVRYFRFRGFNSKGELSLIAGMSKCTERNDSSHLKKPFFNYLYINPKWSLFVQSTHFTGRKILMIIGNK